MASSNTYGIKYEKAVACLSKDRSSLLRLADFLYRSTGNICARRFRLRARSRPFGIERSDEEGMSFQQDRARNVLQARASRRKKFQSSARPQPLHVRWKTKWINWIFVTPRFHHIHHSTDPRYYLANMGNIFSVWDRLFGTYIDLDTVQGELTFKKELTPMKIPFA